MTFTLPLEIAPGQRVDIHKLAVDDLGQTIPTGYQASDMGATTISQTTASCRLRERQVQSLISHFKRKTCG